MSRRRRALALLGLAAGCGFVAAVLVNGYVSGVRAQVGPLVPVLAARADIPKGIVVSGRNARHYLATREVARRFAPGASLRRPQDALGLETAVGIPAGAYVSAGQFRSLPRERAAAPEVGRGERAVEVAASGAGTLGQGLVPGTRVDVLVTSERGPGGGRTFLALDDVEVLGAAPAGDDGTRGGAAENADVVATLRVTVRQAVFLTAAQNFAREVRLLPRPPGDDARTGAGPVDAAGLGR